MKRINTFSCLTIVLALSIFFPRLLTARTLPAVGTQTKEATTAKVVLLLRDSGYTHRKTGANTWAIERPGKTTGSQWILVAAGADFVVVGIIVATKKNMRTSADLSFQLLKLNHSLDYVKVGLDDDDDLFVRTEERIRLIDLQEFKAMVETVNKSADSIYERVKPFLLTP